MLTFEQIKELIELVAQRGLGGLEVERSGFRLKIDGRAATAPSAAAAAEAAPAPAGRGEVETAPAPPAPTPTAAPTGATAESAPAAPPAGAHVVNSPIVGTFYRSSSPDADPFVEVGGRVKKGQVLCIVEAMKIMNEIESEVDGVVVEVYPKNAQAIEFGEPLFAIRTH